MQQMRERISNERNDAMSTTTQFSQRATSRQSFASAHVSDPRTFAEVVHQTRVTLLSLAEGLLGNQQHAEDVVQDVLLQSWEEFAQSRDLGQLAHYLRQRVTERCRHEQQRFGVQVECAGVTLTLEEPQVGDEFGQPMWPVSCTYSRGSWLEEEGSDEEEERAMSPVSLFPSRPMLAAGADDGRRAIERELIALAMENLPGRLRRPLELHFLQGLSLKETSRILHVSNYVLKQRLAVAVRSLKRGVAALLAEGVPAAAPAAL
jgi:RNA polymerase sigma factor (sigma-70 family)